jgi:predicted TIM-barrel enzyme
MLRFGGVVAPLKGLKGLVAARGIAASSAATSDFEDLLPTHPGLLIFGVIGTLDGKSEASLARRVVHVHRQQHGVRAGDQLHGEPTALLFGAHCCLLVRACTEFV